MKLTKSAMSVSATALALAAGTSFFAASPADAVEIYKGNGTVIEFTAEIGLGLFHDDYNLLGPGKKSWQEGYAIMGFKFEQALDANWKAYGAVTGVVNGVRGNGDPIGFELGGENDGQLQDAYGGFKWTDGKEGGASVNVSGGRQKWVMGDGFLIAGDQPTPGNGLGAPYFEGGGYYMNPRRVFGTTAIANIETGTPWRGDVFYIQSEKGYNGLRSIAGANIDYVDKTYGTLGFTYIRGLNMERSELAVFTPFNNASENMNVYSVHGNSSFNVKDFNLAFTYVNEQSDSGSANCIVGVPCTGLDAWAWYISPSYTFSNVSWTPTVYYRFASFSGDDVNTAEYEAYDPLFYGATGYNTWFIGEIAANYSGPYSSNADVHSIGLKTSPNIDLGIGKWTGISGYLNRYSFRELPVGVTSHDFGTELAVYAEFQLFDNLYLSPLYSVMWTDDGFKQFFGKNDDTLQNFQLLGILTY